MPETLRPDMPGCLLTVGKRSWLQAGMQPDGERKSTGGNQWISPPAHAPSPCPQPTPAPLHLHPQPLKKARCIGCVLWVSRKQELAPRCLATAQQNLTKTLRNRSKKHHHSSKSLLCSIPKKNHPVFRQNVPYLSKVKLLFSVQYNSIQRILFIPGFFFRAHSAVVCKHNNADQIIDYIYLRCKFVLYKIRPWDICFVKFLFNSAL